jgi:predicted DNA-binding protein with PD1-like motif
MRTIAVRLRPGADLKGELLALAAHERVQAGWVLTCVSFRLTSGTSFAGEFDADLVGSERTSA